MRILAVTSWFPPHHYGGYELACEDVMGRLVARGHDVAVLCGDEVVRAGEGERFPGRVWRRLRLGVDANQLVERSWRERLALERVNHAALRDAIRDHRPDVVAVWHLGATSTSLLTAIAEAGLPRVLVVCDDWPTYASRLDPWAGPLLRRPGGRRVLALARTLTRVPPPPAGLGDTATLCISERTRDRCLAESPWTLPRPVVVRQGIDPARWAAVPGRDRAQFGWELLYLGRFDERKGCDTLLAALARLPEARCRFDGRATDAEVAALCDRAAAFGVADRIIVRTSTPEELPGVVAAADALIFPSEWEEPFGLAPLEAMAAGVPVVATAVGGSGEFLVDGVNAVTARHGDPADLAEAIAFLAELPAATRDLLVASGRETAAALDSARTADDVEAWLAAAVAGFPEPLPAGRGRPQLGVAPHPGAVRARRTEVRIGIVSWNTAQHLDACLEALPAATEGLDAEVVVVDNASADASAEVAARHGVIVRRSPSNEGYAAGMDRALADATAPVLIALNPDTVPPPRSLTTLVERLLAAPDVGLVAPRLLHPDGRLQPSCYRFPSVAVSLLLGCTPQWVHARIGRRWWLEGHHPHDTCEDVPWAIGAVHVVRAQALAERNAPYDRRWFMYVEDLELCWWLAQHGWRRRLEGDVTVVHVGDAAGSQAWGGTRTARYLACTYDWFARDRGSLASRRWALANTVAVVARAAGLLAFAAVVPGRRRDLARAEARALLAAAPVHARAVLTVPTPPRDVP